MLGTLLIISRYVVASLLDVCMSIRVFPKGKGGLAGYVVSVRKQSCQPPSKELHLNISIHRKQSNFNSQQLITSS